MRTVTPEQQHASFDPIALARAAGSLPRVVAPDVIAASAALYAPFHESEPYEGVRVERDLSYGSHERHRLDVFASAEPTPASTTAAPVLVFVHGGGVVGSDKKIPGTPYHDNVALWAVRHGLVGVNITYRLAPEFPWPAGAEDVGAALDWVIQHAADYGGDPRRVYLMGTSAGAMHVASYVAHPELHLPAGVGAAGAILLSGGYNVATFDNEFVVRLYFGDDAARYPEASSLQGLVETDVPLLIGVAEFDLENIARQALELTQTYFERHRRWPNLVRLTGHNHFTATLHLNTPDDRLGRQILRLIEEAR